MKVNKLFKTKQVLSYEIFPPRRSPDAIGSIYRALDRIHNLKPDFISVTYTSADEAHPGESTLAMAGDIQNDYGIDSVAHLIGSGFTTETLARLLDRLKARGVENILALRGDPPHPAEALYPYATDLIQFIKAHGDFNVVAAAYPETHPEATSSNQDIRYLKAKVDSGADQLITQLFFDNEAFYQFREKASLVGIDVPIQAGIFPVTNKRQVERILTMSHTALPKKFKLILDRYVDNPIALRDAGIAYAVDQIVDLITQDVNGIHLYTMNNPHVATKIHDAISSLF